MGVTYKLKDEVVQFIISQRQDAPLSSCRELAESVNQKFGLRLSKSSVHDVLKGAGVLMPRGRKPKNNKFEIPQEKKKQIQVHLSQIKLLPDPVKEAGATAEDHLPAIQEEAPKTITRPMEVPKAFPDTVIEVSAPAAVTVSPEYDGAGKIFLKAARLDLGIFSDEEPKEKDRDYYLTYSSGIKIILENNQQVFIDLPLPIERCIRETVDGLVNNIYPFIVSKVSDDTLFKACMSVDSQAKIKSIAIVDQNDHILFILEDIMERNRAYILNNRLFMETKEYMSQERSKILFFSQTIDNDSVIEEIVNLRGFDTIDKDENRVTLLTDDSYINKPLLDQAVQTLNQMFLRDEQARLLKVQVAVKNT